MSEPESSSSSSPSSSSKEIEPLRMPTIEEIKGQDIWNNCAVRSAVSGIMGGGLGFFMGLFLGALDNPLMQEEMTGKQQLIYNAKQMGRRSFHSAKTFAVMGLVFSAAECIVEKARAKHDTTNTVVAGCVTGGVISAKGGPRAACVGCAEDERETKHLQALEGADSRLHLFEIDLLNYDSVLAPIKGTVGVFHLASPNIIERVEDPERELLDPAIKGTTNVLEAAKASRVGRVVVTSSISAIIPSPSWPADVVKGEDCWADIDYCKKNEIWYSVSKTLAEKAAWAFAKENNLDVVVVNPGTVLGPILPPTINASMVVLSRLLQGCTEVYEDVYMGSVHVKDVALAHILLYENPSASGRHLCIESICHFSDFAAKVAELYPEYKIPSFPKDTQPGLLRAQNASKKLIDLGLQFIPLEQIIKDAVESLKSKGYN